MGLNLTAIRLKMKSISSGKRSLGSSIESMELETRNIYPIQKRKKSTFVEEDVVTAIAPRTGSIVTTESNETKLPEESLTKSRKQSIKSRKSKKGHYAQI